MAAPVLSRSAGVSETQLELSPPQDLLHIGQNLYRITAQRAYQLYERRGRRYGLDISDWLQAETEIMYPCRHALTESQTCVRFRVELPGNFTADQVKVSVEPHRVIASAQREVMIDYSSPNGHFTRPGQQRLFHIENLPAEVDPARSRATLAFEQLQIVMPRVGAAQQGTPKSAHGNARPETATRPDSSREAGMPA